jgi:hypothetical protein
MSMSVEALTYAGAGGVGGGWAGGAGGVPARWRSGGRRR